MVTVFYMEDGRTCSLQTRSVRVVFGVTLAISCVLNGQSTLKYGGQRFLGGGTLLRYTAKHR